MTKGDLRHLVRQLVSGFQHVEPSSASLVVCVHAFNTVSLLYTMHAGVCCVTQSSLLHPCLVIPNLCQILVHLQGSSRMYIAYTVLVYRACLELTFSLC